MFEEKISTPAVQEYFATLGLDVWDATWAKMLQGFRGAFSRSDLQCRWEKILHQWHFCAMMPVMWELGPQPRRPTIHQTLFMKSSDHDNGLLVLFCRCLYIVELPCFIRELPLAVGTSLRNLRVNNSPNYYDNTTVINIHLHKFDESWLIHILEPFFWGVANSNNLQHKTRKKNGVFTSWVSCFPISEAWSFFKLLDADAGGCVEINEFLMLGLVERKVSVVVTFQLKRLVLVNQKKR